MAIRSAELAAGVRSRWTQSHSLLVAGEFALDMGRPSQAQQICIEGLAVARSIGYRQNIAFCLGLLAWAAADLGQSERAGRIWGAIEAEEANGPFGQWEAQRETFRSHALAAAGPGFERGLLEGRSLTFDEAIEEALVSG